MSFDRALSIERAAINIICLLQPRSCETAILRDAGGDGLSPPMHVKRVGYEQIVWASAFSPGRDDKPPGKGYQMGSIRAMFRRPGLGEKI
jgi:hypothetical protein